MSRFASQRQRVERGDADLTPLLDLTRLQHAPPCKRHFFPKGRTPEIVGLKEWDAEASSKIGGASFILEAELGITEVTATQLAQKFFDPLRGNIDWGSLHRYLSPDIARDVPHYREAKNVEAAMAELIKPILSGSRIGICPDFDADGLTGVAQFYLMLREIGVPESQLVVRIPRRLDEGFGLNTRIVEEFARAGCTHIVCIDNGTSTHAAHKRARPLNLKTLAFDHHLMRPGEECFADFLVNPAQPGCGFAGATVLAAAGVVRRIILPALKEALTSEGRGDLRLCARDMDLSIFDAFETIGTIGDVVPLVGANRAIVKHGLKALENPHWVGLQELIKVCPIKPPYRANAVAFQIAPRINAVGRLGIADLAFRLLTSRNAEEAHQLALQADALNTQRKRIEQEMVGRAERRLVRELKDKSAIILRDRSFHKGVNGIVASRLSEKYRRAVFVGTVEGDRTIGSMRSKGVVHISDLLAENPHTMSSGGHLFAGGASIHRTQWAQFRDTFEQSAAKRMPSQEELWRSEASVHLNLPDYVRQWELLREESWLGEPFGAGNEDWTYMTSAKTLTDTLPDKRHWRGELRQNQQVVTGFFPNRPYHEGIRKGRVSLLKFCADWRDHLDQDHPGVTLLAAQLKPKV